MEGLQRITFRFGVDSDVRYLPSVPERGDRVTHGGDLWVVAFVSADGAGVVVVCEHRDGGNHDLRRVA
jgi:hypothetical protein